MINSGMELAIILGFIFTPIASLMTFIISYEEYKHHFSDTKRPKRMAIEAGIMTFVFFIVLSIITGIILSSMFHS